jgi:hypothetical protein
MEKMRYFSVVLAGFTCADMLRQNGFRGRILLISREGALPYDRVSYLSCKSNKNRLDEYLGSIIQTTIKKTSRITSS